MTIYEEVAMTCDECGAVFRAVPIIDADGAEHENWCTDCFNTFFCEDWTEQREVLQEIDTDLAAGEEVTCGECHKRILATGDVTLMHECVDPDEYAWGVYCKACHDDLFVYHGEPSEPWADNDLPF